MITLQLVPVEDIQDSTNDITNITTQEEEPKSMDNDSAKDVTYTRTAQISVLQSHEAKGEGKESLTPKEWNTTSCY